MADKGAWLRHLAGSEWLIDPGTQPLRFLPGTDGLWKLGELCLTEAAIAAAQPEGLPESVKSFELLHGGWRIAPLRLFRPLAYFAAFSASEIFECLRLAVSSLVTHGCWRHDVLVITAAETLDCVRAVLEPCGLGERLHIARVEPADDLVDWCMARYRLDAHPILSRCQPLLYLDCDIACDRPLDPLLRELSFSAMVHACGEGRLDEGHPDSAGHWFGWRLMQADGMSFDPAAPGFSTGALGVANIETARIPYDLILRSAYGFISETGERRRFEGHDQCFANYVLRKLGMIDIELLPKTLNLHRIDDSGVPFPAPSEAKGLVHFLGAPLAVKRQAMQDYLSFFL